MKSLQESLFDSDLAQKDIMYHPKTKDELIDCIKEQLKIQGPDANLNIIDVSKITDMSWLFRTLTIGNIDISDWDVSKVKDMRYMFYNCKLFNSDLSKWDVSRVENMDCMFDGCKSFNSDLSKWNVSGVENMCYMFCNCSSFNSDISKWDVSRVKYMDYMFDGCKSFNSDLSKWDVSKVEDMNYMFDGCKSLKKFLIGMKSLKESLFDKDLKEKDLKFREVYDLLAGHNGMQVWGMPIGPMFSTTKVTNYKNPYYPETGFFNAFNAGFLGIITDMPVPSEKDFHNSASKWCGDLNDRLLKYVRNDWKQEYKDKFVVELKNRVSNNSGLISVCLRLGDNGGMEYIFKRKTL